MLSAIFRRALNCVQVNKKYPWTTELHFQRQPSTRCWGRLLDFESTEGLGQFFIFVSWLSKLVKRGVRRQRLKTARTTSLALGWHQKQHLLQCLRHWNKLSSFVVLATFRCLMKAILYFYGRLTGSSQWRSESLTILGFRCWHMLVQFPKSPKRRQKFSRNHLVQNLDLIWEFQ